MKNIHILSLIVVLASLDRGLMAAEPLPYGHKEFVPTSDRPIYFRAGNGEYPGATPPLEWREGTIAKIKVAGIYGNPPRHRTEEVIGFGDAQWKNILWKMPVPGWSLSHPIVVGRKVFAVGEPDFVTCWDLETGKQLWQRRLTPLVCDGLDEKAADAGRKMLDLARAFLYIGTRWPYAGQQPGGLFTGWNKDGSPQTDDPAAFVAGKKDVAAKLVAAFKPHRADVEAFGDAEMLKAFDFDLNIFRRHADAADLAALQALANEKLPGKHDPLRPLTFMEAVKRRFGVDMGGSWWGYVGSADSTLASDGQRIYGVFDQGQVFALDLDGNLMWAKRERGRHDNRGTFHSSPLLCNALLLVRDLQHNSRSAMGILRALEVGTGKQRWEVPFKRSNYAVPRLMRLGETDLLIGEAPEQQIVRVSDGKVLGQLPPVNTGRGALMSVCGEVVTWSSASDTGGGPSCSYRLRLEGADKVTAEKLFVLEEKSERIFHNQHNFPTLRATSWLYGSKWFDVVSGKPAGQLPAGVKPDCAVVAGRYLIGVNDEAGPWGRRRDDRMALVRFTVVDIADPTQPKLVSDKNYLGYKEPPADVIVRTYFKDFDPYSFAGCYRGTPSYVTEHMSGPVPHGNRLLIQTTAFMYCIGEK